MLYHCYAVSQKSAHSVLLYWGTVWEDTCCRVLEQQITMEDFQIWKSALGGRSDVQFKSYAGLSHMFMTFEGGEKSTPAVYNVPGHVVEEVIKDIAQWIKHVF